MTERSEQLEEVEISKNRTEAGQRFSAKTRLPKSHQKYWLQPGKLRRRTYVDAAGVTHEIPAYQIRIQHAGDETWFNLQTNVEAAAAKKAAEIYTYLRANGRDAAIAKFKPQPDEASKVNLKIGEYLDLVDGTGLLTPRTFLNYRNCLRTIVSEVFGVRGGDERYDYRAGGNAKWSARIDGIRLERVTPEKVTRWKQRRVKRAGNSQVAIASARRTVNSYIRCARSLFQKDITKEFKAKVQLPAVLPFDGVALEPQGSMKYQSKIDASALVAAAKLELKENDPEAYKVFLLGLFAGMRKAEIDSAEWGMINWSEHALNLEPTEFLHLKTAESAAAIDLDPEVVSELRSLMPGGKSRFIVDATCTWQNGSKRFTHTRRPRNDSARPYYRCEKVFDRLLVWLRGKGVRSSKPLHELRKEIGSRIAKDRGIWAASAFLRHSDITTTSRHYADRGQARIASGLGGLLNTEIKALPDVGEKEAGK